MKRDELVRYVGEYLNCEAFNDYAPNGLQVEGSSQVQRICTAVTASVAAITEAARLKADVLLVHHGYFWRGEDLPLVGIKRQRIGLLISYNINLLAYHLPLDCHPLIGNNVCLGRLLGLSEIQGHFFQKTPNLLWSGSLAVPLSAPHFSAKIADAIKRMPLHISGSEKNIHRVVWCSGAAEDFIEEAHRLGADAYLSGEITERTYYQAQELGMHYFACGHHASERYGIQALGAHLRAHFGLEHQFIDSDNPV